MSRALATIIDDAEFTLCDSCGWFYDESGNQTPEHPGKWNVNTEAGVCPACVAELKRRGVTNFQNTFDAGRGVPKARLITSASGSSTLPPATNFLKAA